MFNKKVLILRIEGWEKKGKSIINTAFENKKKSTDICIFYMLSNV